MIDNNKASSAIKTTSDHIAEYRQHVAVARQRSLSEKEEEIDLFSDMEPKINKQKKLFIGPKSQAIRENRLSAQTTDPILSLGSELENWDEKNAGWEAEDEDMIDVMKEHKRRMF